MIQIAVGKSRRDMCIQNNICAENLEKFQVTPYQSASHPEDDFFSDIFKEQSHGTLEQEINDYLLEQC